MKQLRLGIRLLVAGILAVILAACSSNDTRVTGQTSPDDAGLSKPDASSVNRCGPIQGEAIPARLAVMSADAGVATTSQVLVDDVFNRFNSTCGGCHVSSIQGNFQVSRASFINVDVQKMLDRMQSDDPNVFMPPPSVGGMAASQRSAEDPVTQLIFYLQQWVAAGRPSDHFYISNESSDAGTGSGSYQMTPAGGNALTNLGDCLPDKAIVGTAQAKMDELDSYFAQLQAEPPGQGTLAARIGLPERLEQTDLSTLDTETLAQYGVISYAPGYPLWSDNAGKLRMVRVPRGQTITFDKAAQQFVIPANTRFYKTFLKSIRDSDGSTRFRKIETRLIVSRPDMVNPDGSRTPTALYGTYAWSEDETQAVLVTDPLRNGEPFTDRLITYVTDVPIEEQVAATNPLNLSYALQNANALRHYAIPGSDRCLDCHEGSPSQSFILGFTPLQVKRRRQGEGGVIEPAAPDELNQLQRLIDYGVITGVDTPDDILNLEDSQGDRKSRNDYELVAQGYMLGNCAHCHNPHGDASVDNPILADVLNFMPGPNGGIFQFPLDKFSPRIVRGSNGGVTIPYITPSLMDYPVEDDGTHSFWTPKADAEGLWQTNVNRLAPPSTGLPAAPDSAAFAPWRSLIYRNVDTPFAYGDDFALFPHMPKNVPGYDCRLPQIMGDWMVSIPGRRKNTNRFEYGVPTGGTCYNQGVELCDDSAQPYEEVAPNDPDYQTAVADAQQRLDMYHSGNPWWERPTYGPFPNRYTFCPDTSDIVDPSIVWGNLSVCSPKLVPLPGTVFDLQQNVLIQPNLGVPLRAHWVVTDLTQPPGDWSPRRPDWEQIVVQQNFPTISGSNCNLDIVRQANEEAVVKILQGVTLTSNIRNYALNPIPFGLWVNKPSCKLSSYPTLAQLSDSNPPKWVSQVKSLPAAPSRDSPVYSELPGAAVFNMICINCHGPNADSAGRLASTLATMTGGNVRVANLRDGLFGPVNKGTNKVEVFGAEADTLGITADDLASRYLAWMALGGTRVQIPPAILNLVGNTQVLGAPRKHSQFEGVTATSANMLAAAQELCRHVLPWQYGYTTVPFEVTSGAFDYSKSALIPTNGDAELWQTLCSIDNDPPIRTLTTENWTTSPVSFHVDSFTNLYRPSGYPANTPVGDQYGHVAPSLQSNNTMPWCIVKPSSSADLQLAEQYVIDNAVNGNPLPFCPSSLLSASYQMLQDAPGTGTTHNDLQNWATRGAMNAGLAVFLYLDQVVSHGLMPTPDYDKCEQLSQ